MSRCSGLSTSQRTNRPPTPAPSQLLLFSSGVRERSHITPILSPHLCDCRMPCTLEPKFFWRVAASPAVRPPPPKSAGVPYPFLPWDGALPVHEVHCTVGVFCWDSHKTLRTTTHKHIRATAARGAVHRDTQLPPPPTARQPNLNWPHHRDGVARGPLLCRTQKESFPYKWVVFSPSFPLLGESAESDPRHIQSPAKDGRAAISRKRWLLRPFPRSPAQ